MKWIKQVFKNWDFILILVSMMFLWYYFTFTPENAMNRTIALSLSVSAVLAYIIHSTLEGIRIQDKLDNINSSIKKGLDFKVVKSRDEFLKILSDSIRGAKKSIYVTHFDSMPPTKPYRSTARENYWKTNSSVIKENKVNFTRLISVDNQEKINWINEQIEEFKDCDKYNITSISLGSNSPIVLELLVVDSEMAMIWPSTHTKDEVYLWMTGRTELVGSLQSIFESMLVNATFLKDGNSINNEYILQLTQKLKEYNERNQE